MGASQTTLEQKYLLLFRPRYKYEVLHIHLEKIF